MWEGEVLLVLTLVGRTNVKTNVLTHWFEYIGFAYWFTEPMLKVKTGVYWFCLLVPITKVKNHS